MEITVNRKWKKADYTIGVVTINGNRFCESLEDKDRGLRDSMTVAEVMKIKVKGQTAIPTGRYEVVMSWSPRFKKYLPEIKNVKGFSGIRIHSGANASHTEGCLLLGRNTIKGGLTLSKDYCSTFNAMLNEATKKGERTYITII